MYNVIYYWIYYYLTRLKRTATPGYDTILFIGILQLFNIISVGRFLFRFVNIEITRNTSIYLGLLLAAILLILNFFYLYKRKEKIFKKILEYTKPKRRISNVIFWIYILLSCIVLLIIVNYT
jgi:hypothetical protein